MNHALEQTLDEHIDWINHVTELAAADNWPAVTKAINDLEDRQLRGMLYVLILARGGDLSRLRAMAWQAIEGEEGPVLN
jgi:hypothetical protein